MTEEVPALRKKHENTSLFRFLSSKDDKNLSNRFRRIKTDQMDETVEPMAQLMGQSIYRTITETIKQIDEALLLLSKRINHANYLEEIKKVYIRKMDSLEQEVTVLRQHKAVVEREENQKQMIETLLDKLEDGRVASEKMSDALRKSKIKLCEMGKSIAELEKENATLKTEYTTISNRFRLHLMKHPPDATFRDAINKFTSRADEEMFIFPFCTNELRKKIIEPVEFFRSLNSYVEEGIREGVEFRPKAKYRSQRNSRFSTL